MRKKLMQLRVRKNFVLSANYVGKSKINIVLPGGEAFSVSVPDWDLVNRLPRDMPLIQRITVAFGFKQESCDAKVLAYDFESKTPGISPNPDNDIIYSCSFWSDDYASVFKSDDPQQVLRFFIKVIVEKNPDILTGFFSNRYDMLLAIKESERSGIPLYIGRDGSAPEVIFRRFDRSEGAGSRFKVKMIKINGRLHFDVFDEVLYDQSLIGIKGHGLKDVAKFLKLKHVVEVDRKRVSQLSSVELLNYNLSDSRLTYILAKTYLQNMVQLAEKLELPMNLVMNRTPSHVPNYIYGRDFLSRNVPYSGDNRTRFPQVFSEGARVCYQGAYVDLFKVGIFKPVDKIDFVNLYPAIMTALNLDPETVELVSISPFTDSDPKFKPLADGGVLITVSDRIIGDVACRIDLSKDSATRKFLTKFIAEKARLKPMSKIDPLAKSQYWMIKLVMNAMSGYHGLRYAKWGNVLVIMITTAIARWFIETLCKIEPAKIEADTDGVYLSTRLSDKDKNCYEQIVKDLLPEVFQREFIKLDIDRYQAGIFINEKNYVLQKENGSLLFHGAGLKGKHLPIVCDNALQKLINALLRNEDWRTIVPDIVVFSTNINDFVMKASFNKTNYVGNSLYAQLEKQLNDNDIAVSVGDTARYVKTWSGYSVVELAKVVDIDTDYYLKRIADIIARAVKPIEDLKGREILKILKEARE